eukprot:839343-Pyramimonas_sp.AAC.1
MLCTLYSATFAVSDPKRAASQHTCVAVYVWHYRWCNLCSAIYALHSTLCSIGAATYVAMQSVLCN